MIRYRGHVIRLHWQLQTTADQIEWVGRVMDVPLPGKRKWGFGRVLEG